MKNTSLHENILTIDIGGSFIKATVLSQQGELLQDYERVKTPEPATPQKVLEAIQNLISDLLDYDKISIGFPGYLKKGIVQTAPNLGTELWKRVSLNKLISEALNKPVRIINDADLQGLGVVNEKGLEMIITLGTGFGTALLLDGHLLPHLELAHHPITRSKTYDDYIGDNALKKIGVKKWNKRMKKVLDILKTVFNYDRLYIGGGNSGKLNFKLDENIKIITNKDGIKGGARLWQLDDALFMKSETRSLEQIKSL
ncbi:MAG TPA: ROK family protein [Chitinophagaceae bacterium]|nr:ROK family protein [Chitinophagaceae bacterium]